MSLSTAPLETIEQRTERLVLQHNAKGDLERNFCRDMASSQVTAESYERLIFKLGDAEDPDDRRLGRIQLAKSRALNDGHKALRALMDVQDRRNLIERFPDQTNDCPSLANHAPFIGELPKIKPIPPILRSTLANPTDNTQRHPIKHPQDKELDKILNGALPLNPPQKTPSNPTPPQTP
ncbi:MAG: hypothetical protein IPJ98_21825 [Bryobacterales bacterium]|nr:hypothetical protein [Bryobacterales bacterium]